MGASTHPTTFHPRYACLNLSSKGNTTLNGAQAIARRIDADVGGKLSIISPQDTVEQSIKQSGAGVRLQISFGTAWEASGSYNSSQASGSLNAVNKQSGLFAGDGGYHIQADSVDLKGGAITSTADQDHNDLTANTLTFEDVHNRSRFSAQTVSLSGSYGNNNTEASKGKGYTYGEGYNSGVGYTPSLPQSQSGSDSSTTYATLSPGNITLNGQATTVEALGIHSDAATAHRAVAGLPDLQAILDRQKIVSEATATIASAVQTYSKNQAKEANQAKAEAQADFEAALRQRNDGSWEAYQAADAASQEAIRLSESSAYREAAEAAQSWGIGGDKSRALTATSTLITGLLGGQTDLQAAANAAAPYAAAAIGKQFGHGADQNETAQAVGHFILGATLAYINGGDPLSGGSSAVAAEKAAQYLAEQYNDGTTAIDPQTGEFSPNLLPEEVKEEITAITGAIAGMVGATGDNGAALNAQIGSVIGQNAVVNNRSISKSIDNSAEGCKPLACLAHAVGKAAYEVGTLGFASWHDDWRDKYDNGEITEEEYWRIGVAGGGAIALTNWYGGKWIGDAGSAVTSKLVPTIKLDWSTGWSIRGKQWKAELSKVLSKGYIDLNKYKSNFKTFDFYNPNTKTAISAKSVDTVSSFNGKGGLTSLERQIKGYVNDTLNFRSERAVKNKYKLTQKDIQHREVHIAIPQGTSVDKMKAINNAVNYGKTKGVKVIITETKSR